MSLPTFDYPDSPRIAGDAHDDDATQIDNLVEQNAEPPTAKEMPKETRDKELVKVPTTNRLIAGHNLALEKGWEPVQILPADPHRTHLTILRNSPNNFALLLIAGTADECKNRNTSLNGANAGGTYTLDGYTGAVWIQCSPLSFDSKCDVTWFAVTK